MAIDNKTRAKIEKLLGRFEGNKFFDKVSGPYTVVGCYWSSHSGVLVFHSKNRFFLIETTSNGLVQSKSLDGCIDGKWNVYVYSALEALRKFGLISEKEEKEMRLYLGAMDHAANRKYELERLMDKAKELGYSLVQN